MYVCMYLFIYLFINDAKEKAHDEKNRNTRITSEESNIGTPNNSMLRFLHQGDYTKRRQTLKGVPHALSPPVPSPDGSPPCSIKPSG